jgi:hypothetical protein
VRGCSRGRARGWDQWEAKDITISSEEGLHVTRPWPSPTAAAGESRLSLTNTLDDASITTRTTSVLESYHYALWLGPSALV